MRPIVSLLIFAVLAVFVAGCPERNNTNAVPAKGFDPAIAKMNEAPVVDANAPAGRKVYDAQKCSKCHRIDDAGGPGKGRAPNLAHVGTKRSAEWIAAHVRDPKVHGGKMRAYPESELNNDDLKVMADYLASLK